MRSSETFDPRPIRAGAFSLPVLIPALSLLPSAIYIGIYYGRWSERAAPYAAAGGLLIFAAIYLPMLRVMVRAARRSPEDAAAPEPPEKSYRSAVPLAIMAFALPVWNTLTNVHLATIGHPIQLWVYVLTPVLVCAIACAYLLPLLTAARALGTRRADALEASLLASAVSLFAMGLLARLSSEAQHFHAASRPIGLTLHVASLVCVASALSISLKRWRWARAAFDAKDAAKDAPWGVSPYQEWAHNHLPALGADAVRGDGVIVRFFASDEGPYRSAENAEPVARTWLDNARALRPLARLTAAATTVLVTTLALTPALSGKMPAIAHLSAEDPSPGFPKACAARRDTIYFAPWGSQHDIDLPALAARYSALYEREFVVLPAQKLPEAAYDPHREQFASEAILAAMEVVHHELIAQHAVIIGITSDDLYLRSEEWMYGFGKRSPPSLAIVSSARMRLGVEGDEDARAMGDARLRKMVTRNLGFLYCRSLAKPNPKSVLFYQLMGPEDLDRMDESIW